MRPLSAISPPVRPASPFGDVIGKTAQTKTPETGADKFAKLLTGEVQNVNKMQTDANAMVHTMLTGGNVNEAEVLTAVQKADLAFRMLLQVRNKLIEAYREVQQIQI